MSLFLGPRAKRIFVIEGDREAVRCARLNLRGEGLLHADICSGEVADILGNGFVARGRTAGVVILDPPRDGCGRGVIDSVAAGRPERIIYVSCNPGTGRPDSR